MHYRPEIDGLRAIAILPVLLFHAGYISGGYLGVDIFFIISGYLITGIILKALQDNQFSFANFYERRARRILPILLFVMLAIIPLAWYLMSGTQLKKFAYSIISVELFVSNFWFLFNTNYFALPAELLPLLHTWSLAVEEQFYILYPFILVILWKYTREYILFVLLIFFACSILYAQYIVSSESANNFYLLPSRIWELSLGAILTCLEIRFGRRGTKLLNNCMPILGLIIITWSFLCFNKDLQGPSIITLIPAFGTAAIIWFSGTHNWTTRLLSSKIFVGTGLISYSMYLWHQPILALSRLNNLGNLSEFTRLIFIPLTFFISYLSWTFIETRFRSPSIVSSKTFIYWIMLFEIILFTVAITFIKVGAHKTSNIPMKVIDTFQLITPISCGEYTAYGNADWLCKVGNIHQGSPDFVAYGDSHVRTTILAIDNIAKKENLFGVISRQSACSPIFSLENDTFQNAECRGRNESIYKYIKENNIKTVILIARWSKFLSGNNTKIINLYSMEAKQKDVVRHKRFSETLKMYNSIGTKVIIMLQSPEQINDPKMVYEKVYSLSPDSRTMALQKYSLPANVNSIDQQQFKNFLTHHLTEIHSVMDPTPLFCDQHYCLIGTLDASFYRDTNHLSNTGSAKLKPLFLKELQNIKR